jgi:tRNA nucleotidyltransferase/poly(A) polymerase
VEASSSPVFAQVLERVQSALPSNQPIYLVGGAVRDALLGRPTHDLDFVLSGNVLAVARRIANRLGGAFYVLDEERETGRVILQDREGKRETLDFAALRGADLESDLQARDFTINAMAVPTTSLHKLIDPLHGLEDLRSGEIRACSDTTFQDDPVRILRAVRQASALNFRIVSQSQAQMRSATRHLENTSPERLRDEIFRIFEGLQPATALRALDILGALQPLFPELQLLKGVVQSPPHQYDVWEHSLKAVEKLESILEVLAYPFDPQTAENLALGTVSLLLGRFREQISEHLARNFTPERTLRQLLFFIALYHDTGKPETRSLDKNYRIRFFGHEDRGAEIAVERARSLRLSNEEVARIETVTNHHLRPTLLAQIGALPSSRAIYRFFRDTGSAGVDVCLLSLADKLATYGSALPQDAWANHVEVVRALLEAWWEKHEEEVTPPALVNGRDLMDTLGLQPGPLIGDLLEGIREAQAAGDVKNRRQALEWAQRRLKEQEEDQDLV